MTGRRRDETANVQLRSAGYELFMALLTLLSIANMALVLLPLMSGGGRQVVLAVELILAPVFLADFLFRLAVARPRRAYLVRGWGWADLLAVVPLLRVLRLFHLVVVVRALRSRGPGTILADLYVSRAAVTFYVTIFLVIAVLELAGALVLDVEAGAAGATIRTPGDALWWGYVTITTVGYGDEYPVTAAGRVIGVFLLTAGVALFSVFTGFIANAFLAPRRRGHRLARRPEAGSIRAELEALHELLDEHDDHGAALRERLDALERALVAASPPRDLEATPSRDPAPGPGGA